MNRPTVSGKVGGNNASNSPLGTDAEGLLAELSNRQFLQPHRPLKDVIAETVQATGLCPDAAARALTWLNLPPDRSIGRLRRGELIQLARCMHRYWLESANATAAMGEPR